MLEQDLYSYVQYCGSERDMLGEEIHIRIDQKTLEEIDDFAKELGLNRSQLIRLAIKSFLKHRIRFLSLLGEET